MNVAPSTFEAQEEMISEIRRARPSDVNLPVLLEDSDIQVEVQKNWGREKCVGALFYFLAGITGLLVIQVIWQIATEIQKLQQ